ncbi:MAG: amino acid adenylation domain-containing protein [Actinobacteria bacterium]|nr:amino acid adenylation domain-containing protein [Actinomycetota bacterium]
MAEQVCPSAVFLDLPVDFARAPEAAAAAQLTVPARCPAPDDAPAWWSAVLVTFLHRQTASTSVGLIGDDLGDGRVATCVVQVSPEDTVDAVLEQVRAGGSAGEPVPRSAVTATTAGPVRVTASVRRVGGGDVAAPGDGACADLTLRVSGDGATADLAVAAGLWSPDTVHRMARQIARVAEFAAGRDGTGTARQDTPIRDIVLLDPQERARIVVDWNATGTRWPPGSYLDLLAACVARDPERLAVSGGGRTVNFGQLDRVTNQIARRLQRIGAAPGTRIGLLAPRGVEFVMAAIGILKTGAAAVLLDPANPDPRLAYLIEDSAPMAVLAPAALRERIAEGPAFLPVDGTVFDRESTQPVPVTITDDTVSHLIYTSGSTGEPKAVLERHGALVNLVHWTGRAYGVRAGDQASWLSTPGFAVQLMEWMPYLALGVTIHIGDMEDRTPEQIRDWLVTEGITHTMLVAALAERVWTLAWPADARLRIMVTTAERVHSWPPADTAFRVVMTYGSTETTNVLTCLDLGTGLDLTAQATPDTVRSARPVPVGRPIANLRAYLLDDADRPVPVGVVGRLHVAGAGLAAGYHQRPELTAARFRPNPFAEEPAVVLYDTGDLARYRADGAIELLGRLDAQVKIRGFRVELGEVESAVRGAPNIGEAVVTTRESDEGDLQLVTHVAPVPGRRIQPAALRAHLAQRLPYYMVPTVIICLRVLPRLSNGKVDLRGLPAEGDSGSAEPAVEPAAPRNEVEAALLCEWSRLFRLERIGVHDNFFDLGGYSLLAFQFIDHVRTAFGVETSLPDLYRCPTVAQLAEHVVASRDRGSAGFGDLPPIVGDPARRHDEFPLTDSQQALWIGRGDAVALGNVGCHGYFEWDGDLDPARFAVAWRALVRRHDALRTVIGRDGTQRVLSDPPDYPIPVLDLRSTPADDAEKTLLALRDQLSHQVMDDGQWPLFDVRMSLLPDGLVAGRRTRLHLSLDFLISDAWSYFQVLVPDLVHLYEHPDDPLPELTLTFRDYVLGVGARLPDSDIYRRSELYWRGRLASLPPAPRLPGRPASQPPLPVRFDRCGGHLDRTEWAELLARGNEIGVTGSVLLAAVFAEVLRSWSGQQRFTINFPLFNRLPLHPEVHRIIGDTTTTLLLAVEKTDGTFTDRAVALQQQLWADLEHRYFSGVQVLRELTKLRGTMAPAMPIVMTSLAGHPPRHHAASLGTATYSISQTPQVEIDFQVFEVAGQLQFNWDFLPAIFPDGFVEGMFADYCAILERLRREPDAWEARTLTVGGGTGHAAADPAAPAPAWSRSVAGAGADLAWERFWSGVRRTGADGDVLWDPDDRAEIEWCLGVATERMDRSLPVVDVGCGNGRFSRAFASRFPLAVGVDVSPSAVREAESESAGLARASYRVLDATRPGEAMALADEIGDTNVFVRGVLHILDDRGRAGFAAALAELVGRRGTVLLVEPMYEEGSFGYVGQVGGAKGRAADLVGPLERAGVGASGRFADAERAWFFPAGAGWRAVASGTTALRVLNPEHSGGALEVPGYFAVLTRSRC